MKGLLSIYHKAHNEGKNDAPAPFQPPQTGGIILLPAMIAGIVITIAIHLISGSTDDLVRVSSFILAAGLLLIYALATIEDILDTSRWRHQAVILVACAVLPLVGLYINDLHGLFGIRHVGCIAGFIITFVFSILTVKGLEALNNTDGLLPATSIDELLIFGVIFCSMRQDIYATMAFALAGALAVFLRFNMFGDEKLGDKVRMGHAGTLVTAFCIVYLSLKYAMDNRNVISEHADAVLLPYSLLAFPIFEYIRVWTVSSWKGLKPECRNKCRIQHVILSKGFTVAQTTGIILLGEMIIITLNLLLHHLLNLNITWIVLVNIAVYVELLNVASQKIKVPKQKVFVVPDDFKDYIGQEGLVSIIMPAYNSSQFVADSIDSIIAQTYKNWELIITDDCSTDNTRKILDAYAKKDPRIILQTNEVNGGTGVSRNRSIAAARGQYIAFCDSDDRWLPKKLELQLEFMHAKNVALCFAPYYSCDENSQYRGYVSAPKRVSLFSTMCDDKIGFLTCIYDASLLGKHLMPTMRRRQDYAMVLGLLKICKYAYSVPAPLAHYRIRDNSLSSKKISLLKYNARTYTIVFGWSKVTSYVFLFLLFLPTYFTKRFKNILINAIRSM